MNVAPLYYKLAACEKKIIVVQGGGDAGKTVTILQHFALMATQQQDVFTVTGQDSPNLKVGAMRSFENYVASDPDIEPYIQSYNKTDRVYTFKNKSIIEFKTFENEQDARGSERGYLFMNEANSRTYNLFWQLQRKTRKKVFLDYNPSSAFWAHTKLINGEERQFQDQVQLYIVDHRHNPFLSKEEHLNYESISDPDLFRVYSRGLTGKVIGLIFGHFKKIDALPEDGDRTIYAIDYGYTADPTAIVKIMIRGRQRFFQELSYEPGIGAEGIKKIIVEAGLQPGQLIYSEADPNMVHQLRSIGLPVYPAIKGPGSIAAGISKVKEFECFYVPTPNFEKELLNYKWVTAQDLLTGKEVITNTPIDVHNHLCDSLRYGVYTDAIHHRTG